MAREKTKGSTGGARLKRMNLPGHLLMLVWAFVVLLPVYLLVVNALKTRVGMYSDPFALPSPLTLDNFRAIINQGNFFMYFTNSLVVVILSLGAILLMGSLAGYGLAHWKSKAARGLYFFFIIGMMLPIKIATIRLMELMKLLGLFNQLWSIILVYTAMGLPIAVFVLTEFIRGLPGDLYEAAHMDGARRGKIYLSVVLPLIKPALATVGIYNLVPIWNDLWFPLIFITQEDKKTVLLAVTKLQGQYTTDWPKVFALLTLSALPVIILYLSMSKQFVTGLTAGAVKG